jgi:hypothetical protein
MITYTCQCGTVWNALTCFDGSRWWFLTAHASICPDCGRQGEGPLPEPPGRDPSREPVAEGRRCGGCRATLPKRSFGFAGSADGSPCYEGARCKECRERDEREMNREYYTRAKARNRDLRENAQA